MKKELNKTSARGQYKIAVVEAVTGKTVWEMPEWRPNLILTKGMDKKASLPWEDLFTHACAGSGTTANYISTGSTVWTHYGPDVYSDSVAYVDLSAGSVVPGDTLVVSPTTERCIVSIASGTSFIVDPSLWSSDGPWTNSSIAKASRTALDAELKRTNTWVTGWPYCGTVINGAAVCMRRTYNFGVESAQATYGEVGFTWSPDAAEPLFSRIVLDAPVTVDAGFYLRAFYELQVTHSPSTPSYITIPIAPNLTAGVINIQAFAGTCTSYVATNGSSAGTPLVEGLDKVASPKCFISDSQAVIHNFGTFHPPTEDGPNYAEVATTKEPYRDKSFFFVRAATFVPGDFTGLMRLHGLIGSNSVAWNTYFCALHVDYTTAEVDIHDITASEQVQLRWQFSWSRYFYDIP